MTGSLRAVETLSRVDPEFAELVDVLYGGAVDPELVWEDAFAKRGPQMSEQERRQRTEARIGLASNYVGLAAGTAGLAAAAQDPRLKNSRAGRGVLRAGKVAGKLVPAKVSRTLVKHPGKVAAGALGLQAANIGGDIVANRVLGRSAKGSKKVEKMLLFDDVEKFAMPKAVKRISDGILMRTKGQTSAPTSGKVMGPIAPPSMPTAQPKPGGGARAAGRGAGRAVVAGGIGAGAFAAGQGSGRKQTEAQYGITKADAPAVTWAGEFSKFDEDKRLAFGWASVVEKDGLPVVDRQGDYISPEDMETAAYVYVQKSRVGGDMHRRDHENVAIKASDLVESVVFTKEKIAKMGLPSTTPIGWWVGFKVHDDEVWAEVKKGGRTGFSIHGRGRRKETTVDDVMAGHR